MKSYKCGSIDITLSNIEPLNFDSVLIFLNHGSRWVLGFNPVRKGWELPGGHREKNESVDDTARREALEEVGAYIDNIQIKGYYTLPNNHRTVFVTANAAGFKEEQLLHEITEVQTFDEFPENITFKDGVYGFIAELLAADRSLNTKEFVPSPLNNWENVWESSEGEKYSHNKLRTKIADTKIELLGRQGIKFNKGERILELGCGDASFVISLADKFGVQPSGVDFSKEALTKAQWNAAARNVMLDCFLADVRCTPYSDASFDKVISLGIIEHFKSTQVALAETHRVLKSQGQIILMTPNKNSFGVIDRKIQSNRGVWPFGFQTEYTPDELRNMSEQAGFQTIASFSSHRPFYTKDKLNLQMVGLLDRTSSFARKDSGFYSWYVGCRL